MDHNELIRPMRLFFPLAALAGMGTLLYAADVATHSLGVTATQKLSADNDALPAGYYGGTTLHDVDADLSAENIVVSTTVFGFAGTFTSDANATAGDIMASSTAYVNGVKLTGTILKRTLGGTRVYIAGTGAGTWTVPTDWASLGNTIEVIGGGGSSGAAYSKSVNVALTPGSDVSYYIGSGGSPATSGVGGDTWFCDSTSNCASLGGSAVVAGAQGGQAWTGGAAASGKCTGAGCLKYSGGNCGSYGGGGAAGPYGNGANGVGTSGGVGDNGYGGNGGSSPNQAGGNGTEWDATHGSGGGGYGAADGNSGAGGLYGGAIGMGSPNGKTGGGGIIVITYWGY